MEELKNLFGTSVSGLMDKQDGIDVFEEIVKEVDINGDGVVMTFLILYRLSLMNFI